MEATKFFHLNLLVGKYYIFIKAEKKNGVRVLSNIKARIVNIKSIDENGEKALYITFDNATNKGLYYCNGGAMTLRKNPSLYGLQSVVSLESVKK